MQWRQGHGTKEGLVCVVQPQQTEDAQSPKQQQTFFIIVCRDSGLIVLLGTIIYKHKVPKIICSTIIVILTRYVLSMKCYICDMFDGVSCNAAAMGQMGGALNTPGPPIG